MLLQMALFHSLLMVDYHYNVYIYHKFFIISSVGGHLGCFQVLAIINNASVNIGVHMHNSRMAG